MQRFGPIISEMAERANEKRDQSINQPIKSEIIDEEKRVSGEERRKIKANGGGRKREGTREAAKARGQPEDIERD